MSETLKDFIAENKHHLILFHLLSDEDVELVLPYVEMKQCAKGSVLFNEGDSGDYIGIIVSGKMDVKKHTEFKGGQPLLLLLKRGLLSVRCLWSTRMSPVQPQLKQQRILNLL